MFSVGTSEMIAAIVVATIALLRSFRQQASNFLKRGVRTLLGVESYRSDGSNSLTHDLLAALLVIALFTISAACIVEMLSH